MMLRTLVLALAVGVAVSLPARLSPRGPSPHAARSVDHLIKTAGRPAGAGRPRSSFRAPSNDDDDTVLVELDMKMKKDYHDQLHGRGSGISPRKGLRDEAYRWTNNKIPYVIDSYFNDYEKGVIRDAMDEWEKYTCLKMTARSGEDNYLNIISGSGCWSWVGMNGGLQELSLDVYGCVYHHTAVHELGHAVGYHHEQTRPDRDNYVQIHLDNIQSGQEYNFEKYDWKLINDFGVTYDYWSVMHYSAYAFSIGGKTITTKQKGYDEIIGSVPGLSFKDIQAANLMYKCDSHCTNSCPTKAIRTKDCKCWCNTNNPGNPVVEWDKVSECMGGDDFNDTCINFHETCDEWANDGECDSNPAYMLVNCRKSCKICGENQICKDYNKDCEYWAMIGECTANPGFMTLRCRKSCKVCGDDGGGDPDACEDKWDLCPSAAGDGDCETYAASMLWECPVSCQVCGNNTICRNWDILCNTWEDMGECEANPKWMKRHCARACKQCDGEDAPDCKNYQSDADCDYWASIGECVLNPGFMLYKCAKSCRVCGADSDCLNYSPNCGYWKDNGLCQTDKPGMNFNCPLSCGICTGDGKDTADCQNHDFNCEGWEEMGECDANPPFMLYYCPRSCRVCGADQVCKNFHESCEQWATEGECESNPGYMHLHCRPACGLCTPTGGTTTIPGPTPGPTQGTTRTTTTGDGSVPSECQDVLPDKCEDYPTYDCAKMVSEGVCENDPSEGFRVCAKSCQMCGPDVKCKDYNEFCEDWASTGQCSANPTYMFIYCRKSCQCC